MHSQAIIIREATTADLEPLLNLSDQLVKFDYQFDNTLDLNWAKSEIGRKLFQERLANSDGVVYVALLDSKIVGYLIGGLVEPQPYRTVKILSELEEIFVKPECRKLHVGSQLTEAFFAWSKKMRAEKICVVVSRQNLSAIDFYARIGFQEHNMVMETSI